MPSASKSLQHDCQAVRREEGRLTGRDHKPNRDGEGKLPELTTMENALKGEGNWRKGKKCGAIWRLQSAG